MFSLLKMDGRVIFTGKTVKRIYEFIKDIKEVLLKESENQKD